VAGPNPDPTPPDGMLEGGLQSVGDAARSVADEASANDGGVGGAAAAGATTAYEGTVVPPNEASTYGDPANNPSRQSSRVTVPRAAEGSAGAVVRRRQIR